MHVLFPRRVSYFPSQVYANIVGYPHVEQMYLLLQSDTGVNINALAGSRDVVEHFSSCAGLPEGFSVLLCEVTVRSFVCLHR